MTDSAPGRGIALMLAALFCFALLDATSKHLSQTFSVPLLVWARYTFHFLLMVVFLAPSRRSRLSKAARIPGGWSIDSCSSMARCSDRCRKGLSSPDSGA